MKPAISLAVGALAAALLLSGTGTTTAAWTDEAQVEAGTITAGGLDVSLARSDGLTRKYVETFSYTVSAQVTGDNLAAYLRIHFEENTEVDVSAGVPTSATIDVADLGLAIDARTEEIVVGVVSEGGVWPGPADTPVVEAVDGTAELSLTFSVTEDASRAAVASFLFAGGDLVVTLDQVRPDALDTAANPGLWGDDDLAEVPSIGSVSVSTLATDVAAASEVQSAVEDSGASEASEESTADAESTSDENADDAASSDTTSSDTAAEPDWAEELLAVIDQAGLDVGAIDPADLPAEIEDWATEHEIPVDEIVAWLERSTS